MNETFRSKERRDKRAAELRAEGARLARHKKVAEVHNA